MPSEENGETAEQKREKKYWPLALLLTLLLLGGGGYYALTGLKDTAHKLGGGSDYDQLSANSSIYEGKAGGRQGDVFGDGDELPGRGKAAASASRLNPSLFRTREELLADASGRGSQSPVSSSAGQPDYGEERGAASSGGGHAAPAAAMPGKLQARASLGGGGSGDGARSKGQAGGAGAFGSGTAVGVASAQRETAKGSAKNGEKGGVLESLKGAFRASFYGARIASNDAAKSWVSRAFDATPEATTSIEYSEEVRSKLDRVDPSSIPGFLRDQEVSAAEAKHLADSEVATPVFSKGGTEEALKHDDKSQIGKMLADMSGGMMNSLFKGVSGTGSPGDPGGGMNLQSSYGGDGGGMDSMSFDYSGESQGISDDDLQLWVDQNGFGGECGCTQAAPCCCLPNSGQQDGAGTTGNLLWTGPDAGDFSGGDTMWV